MSCGKLECSGQNEAWSSSSLIQAGQSQDTPKREQARRWVYSEPQDTMHSGVSLFMNLRLCDTEEDLAGGRWMKDSA